MGPRHKGEAAPFLCVRVWHRGGRQDMARATAVSGPGNATRPMFARLTAIYAGSEAAQFIQCISGAHRVIRVFDVVWV